MCFERSYCISSWEQDTKKLKLVPNLSSKMYIKILIGLIHDSKTSYDCSIYDHNFCFKCTLRKHVEQIHENKFPHTCLICDHNDSLKCTLKYTLGKFMIVFCVKDFRYVFSNLHIEINCNQSLCTHMANHSHNLVNKKLRVLRMVYLFKSKIKNISGPWWNMYDML